MKVLKRLFAGFLSGIIAFNLMTPFSSFATVGTPSGWKSVEQFEGAIADKYGRHNGMCFACCICTMNIVVGNIKHKEHHIIEQINWGYSKGYVAYSGMVNSCSGLANWVCPESECEQEVTFKDLGYTTVGNLSADEIVEKIKQYRADDCMVIINVPGHYILTLDPTPDGNDFEMYDSGKSKDYTLRESLKVYGKFNRFRVIKCSKPIPLGSLVKDDGTTGTVLTTDTEDTLKQEAIATTEAQDLILDSSDYNATELESIALLKNKFLTTEDLACIKFNMIVSQFCVPYQENIPKMLENSAWQQFLNIEGLDLNSNVYYREKSTRNPDALTTKLSEYVEYLKKNKDKIKRVFNIFKDENKYYYTPVLTSDGKGASLYNLYNDDALFIHDNIALIGDDVEEKEVKSNNDNEAFLETTTPTTPVTTVDRDTTQTESATSTTGELVITSDTDSVWSKMSNMKSLLDGDLTGILKAVKKGAITKTTTVPVFINTDSTYAYNTMFLNNYLKITGNKQTVEEFYNSNKDLQLYIDQYGNIYYNNGSLSMKNYTLVYPAYANPLYTSIQLQDNDMAGVYYEDYDKILKDTSITSNVGDYKASKYFITDNDKVKISSKELDKVISTAIPTIDTKDVYLGVGYGSNDGIFQQRFLTNSKQESTSSLQYRRTNYSSAIKLDRPTMSSTYPYARIDTTTNNIVNKTTVSMMNKYSGEDKVVLTGGTNKVAQHNATDWYWDLATPLFKYRETEANQETLEEIEKAESAESTVNSSLSIENFDTFVVYKGDSSTSNAPVNQTLANGVKIRAGDYYVTQVPLIKSNGSDSQFIAKSGSTDIFSYGKESLTVDLFNKDIKTTKSYSVPVFTYLDGFKGLYNDTTYTLSGGLRKAVLYKSVAKKSGKSINSASDMISTQGYSINTKDSISTDYLAEDYYLMNVMDSDRFNTYLTLNTDFNLKSLTGAIPESITYNFINNKPSSQYTLNNFLDEKGLSIPILTNVLDDASGWGIKDSTVEITREVPSLMLSGKGLLTEFPYTLNKYVNSSQYTKENSGLKMETAIGGISSRLTNYPVSDIIIISMIWDTYYLNNSPLLTKTTSDAVTTGGLYDSTVLTPYNSLKEENNNKLYYTKLTNNSLELGINFRPTVTYTLTDSFFYAKEKVFVVQYNVPNLLLSVYKNGYGDNLQRWVDELNTTSKARTVMELIDTYTSHVITGFKNLIISLCQGIHNQINGGGNASLLRITLLIDTLIEKGYFGFLIVISVISLSICVFKICFEYIFNHKIKLIPSLSKLIAISLVPLLVLTVFQTGFKEINNYGLKFPNTKMVLNSLEEYKTTNRKYIDTEDILLDWFNGDTNTFNEITLLFTINSEGETVEVSLQDLYKSIDYKTNLYGGELPNSFNAEQKMFNGLAQRDSIEWYNTESFVPVNYNKYNASVFYYFYDWLKSQFLMYNANSFTNFVKYEEPEVSSENTEEVSVEENPYTETYLLNMKEAEQNYKKSTGLIRKMLADREYISVIDDSGEVLGVSDLLGLSNLFNIPILDSEESLMEWSTEDKVPFKEFLSSDLWDNYRENLLHKGVLMLTSPYCGNRMNDEGRVAGRFYGSLGLLKKHTGKTNALEVEKKLNKVNDTVYSELVNLLALYDDSEITDDSLIFVASLLATFEFNREFLDGSPVSLNNERIDFDDILKSVYTTKVYDKNLFYNVYFSDNDSVRSMLLIVFLTVGEVSLALSLMIRLLVYTLLIFAIIVVSYYYSFVRRNSLNKIIAGFIKQILILFIGQVVILSWINISIIALQATASYTLKIVTSSVLALIGIVLVYWYSLSLIGLIKDIGNFGGNIIDRAMQTITNTASGIKGKLFAPLNELFSVDLREKINTSVDSAINERRSRLKLLRRKDGVSKLNNVLKDKGDD